MGRTNTNLQPRGGDAQRGCVAAWAGRGHRSLSNGDTHASHFRQNLSNESLWGDWLRFVARVLQQVYVPIFRNEPLRLGRDGKVRKFIIIRGSTVISLHW